MTIDTDLNLLNNLAADVCIVGSGPVGACLAIDLVERGLSVVVLESGSRRPRSKAQSLSEAVIETPRFHEPMADATCRAFGGTSWLWGGRCAELEEIDFAARDYVPNSGWPISYQDVSRFYPRAAELIGVGTGRFRKVDASGTDDLQLAGLEIWANETRIHRRLQAFSAFERIRFVLNATVVDAEIDAESHSVSGLIVANERQRVTYRGASHYVLALGGVETARLLLNVRARQPLLFGGPDGPLGRFYMGHISGGIADIRFSSPQSAARFKFEAHPTSACRLRLTLSDAVQRKHGLPNIAYFLGNPRLGDASHGSGFLSLAYLLLNLPVVGPTLIPEALRKAELEGASGYMAHARNCIEDFLGLSRGVGDFVRQRFRSGRRVPRWFEVNESGIYRLHYHGEQRPRAENRVSLAAARDPLGMHRAAIRFEFGQEDVDGVYEAHYVVDRCLRDAALGELIIRVPRENFLEMRAACSADGLHQIGTTRMASRPGEGVVDPDSRVFDFRNLFVAGSSVFCTSGQANPTFPAIALGLRLAQHLEQSIGRRNTPIAVANAKPLRILHVVPSIEAASGGPARAVFDLALAVRARGHEVTICATDFGGGSVDHAEYLKAGIKVVVFPVVGPPLLQYSREMLSYIRDTIASFDIVHLHSLYLPPDWMVYRYALEHGIPYILRPHGTFDPVIRERKKLPKWALGKLFQNRVTAAAAGIHYTSDDERRLSNCSNLNAWVIPLPIRPEEFDGEADPTFLSRYGVRPEFILFLGRLAWKKGADIAVRAFAEFVKTRSDVDFVIAGPDSGEEAKLRALVDELGVGNNVHFTGLLDGPARIAAYKLAKVFVVPSRGENFGRTVAEAMITGTPIVMSDCIGIWKQLVRDDAACVVEADVPSLLRGLAVVWDSYPSALERASRARRLVETQFAIAPVGEQLERMYYDVLGTRE